MAIGRQVETLSQQPNVVETLSQQPDVVVTSVVVDRFAAAIQPAKVEVKPPMPPGEVKRVQNVAAATLRIAADQRRTGGA